MLSPSPFLCGRVLRNGGVATWSTLEKHIGPSYHCEDEEPDLLASDASFHEKTKVDGRLFCVLTSKSETNCDL